MFHSDLEYTVSIAALFLAGDHEPDRGSEPQQSQNDPAVPPHHVECFLPMFADQVSDSEKGRHPKRRPEVCEPRESPVVKSGHPGNEGRKMADAQDEVTERQ